MNLPITACWGAILLSGCGASEPFRSDAPLQTERAPAGPVERGDAAAFRSAMLDVHNHARRDAGVPAMRWDEELADDARRYAGELARANRMRHSAQDTRPGQGENLWAGTRGAYGYAEMAGYWVEERRHYRSGIFPDVSTTGAWSDVGHYTQIIWRATTSFGCAIAANANTEFLVCRYAPAGNVVGRNPTAG